MYLQQVSIPNTYTTETVVTDSATANKFMFPDIPYLRFRKVVGLSASGVTLTIQSSKNNLCSRNYPNSKASFVTIVDTDGNQFIQNMPVAELAPFQYSDPGSSYAYKTYNTQQTLFWRPRIVAWEKSFVYLPVAIGVASGTYQFNIFYL